MDLLTRRITPRTLTAPGPSAESIAKALDAAEAAPDHGRLRPWRFIVIEGEGRERFGALMAEALKLRTPETDADSLEKERSKPLRAPLIIVLAAEITAGKIPEIEQVLAAGAAAQNLQLAFHAEGFGVQWKSGAASFDPHVKQGLGLKPEDHIIGFMYVGTIAEEGRARGPRDPGRTRNWP